jgi:hypothetical protein
MEGRRKDLASKYSVLTAAPTKRMIVEDFPGKGKIFFRLALRDTRLGRAEPREA